MKINKFLINAKSIYENFVKKNRVVLGNQAADLDSIVSSISLAYFLSNTNDSNTSYIPIINSTKSIIKTKKECMYLFEYLSIDLEKDLLFISDWKKDEISEVILVDHNELDSKEKELCIADLVSGLIDHRLDKQLFLNANPRIVDPTIGSCSTLISDLLFKSKFQIEIELATILLFPILSDTNNLTTRTSQKDIEIVEKLKAISNVDIKSLYSKIVEYKFDTSNENLMDSLIKDYKQYENESNNWGMSSVSFSVKTLVNDIEKINEYMKEKELYFYAILSCFKINDSNEFKRDLILFGNQDLINKMNSNLVNNLTLIEKNTINSNSYLLYDVHHVNLTRKYWQPELEKILKN